MQFCSFHRTVTNRLKKATNVSKIEISLMLEYKIFLSKSKEITCVYKRSTRILIEHVQTISYKVILDLKSIGRDTVVGLEDDSDAVAL